MARQTINIGTSANKGDGDPLRTAFDKINDNFAELYAGNNVDPENTATNLVPDTDGTRDLGSSTKRWGDIHVRDFIYLNEARIEIDGNGVLLVNGSGASQRADVVGDIFGQDSSKVFDSNTNTFYGTLDGDVTGSVFADDSTLLVDGVNGRIVGPIDTAAEFVGDGLVIFDNDWQGNGFYSGLTTNKSTLRINGADNLNGGDDGGGITIAGGSARNGGNNGDVIISSGVGGANGTGIISLLADGGISTSNNWIGTQTMDIKGSVFGDDSTVLVDGVAGKIVGDIKNSLIETDNITALPGASDLFIQGGADSGTPGNRARVNIGTTNTSTIILGAGDTDIYFNGTPGSSVVAGRLIGDLTGSVFADDSTVLVDGTNGTIPASVVSGTITNAIFTDSLETITDIRFGTYADARKPKISIAGIGENNIAITAGYDINTDDSGNVSINANTDGAMPGVVNIATSSGELSLSKAGGTVAVGGNLNVAGDSSTTGNIVITGLAFVGGSLSVTGDVGLSSNVAVSGDLSVAGHLSVTGNTDLRGSIFADDSTLLVDGVAGKIVGDYENGTSTIGSTRVESYDIKALQDLNTLDSYVNGTLYGGATSNIKNLVIGSTAPSTSNGASGDRSGMIAFDSNYIYYCTANYTDGVADIWKRVAWSGDTW